MNVQLINPQEEPIDLLELINNVKEAAEGAGGIVQSRLALNASQITSLNSLLATTIPAPSGSTRDVYVSYKS